MHAIKIQISYHLIITADVTDAGWNTILYFFYTACNLPTESPAVRNFNSVWSAPCPLCSSSHARYLRTWCMHSRKPVMSSSVSMSSCPCQLHWTNKVSKAAPQDLHLRACGMGHSAGFRDKKASGISNQWTLAGSHLIHRLLHVAAKQKNWKHARSVCTTLLPVLSWHTSPLTWMWVEQYMNPGSSGTLWYHNCHLLN